LIVTDDFPVGVNPAGLLGDTMLAELAPIVRLKDGSDIKHGACSFERPSHPTPFHPIFDEVTARTFDHPGGDRISRRQVFVIFHPRLVSLEVATDPLQVRQFFALELRE
jgi:hypothetical protein